MDRSVEAAALRELVESPGWRIFVALVEERWGDSPVVAKTRQALSGTSRGDQDGIDDTVQQILTSQREVQKVLAIPEERIAALTPEHKPSRAFEALRRIGR